MAKFVMFSEVRGVVLEAGKPVEGAVIERKFHWGWASETSVDRVTTGADGTFFLPRIERHAFLAAWLPHEPVILQTIVIHVNEKTYKAWSYPKGNYKDKGELGGNPIMLTCRLENEPSRKGEVFGICELG